MKLLSILSPAETMLIINSDCSLKNMIKFTFMDLLLKIILEIKTENRRVLKRDKYSKKVVVIEHYNYVTKGKNFNKYTAKEYELIFLEPYLKNPLIKILFKDLVKMSYKNSVSGKSFKKKILNSKNINQLFKVNIFQKIFGGMYLTSQGIKTKNEIIKYLKPIGENIDNLLNRNKKKALELLLSLGGNIFLLNNLDFALLKKIDKQLLKEQKIFYFESYDSVDDLCYYFDSYAFESYFNYFDNSINSFDSSFDYIGCFSGDIGLGGFD
ncbi:MAG: hypothetical protein HRT66_09765 [Flavobacteriaceae bacterium]|nr:hypothetical protein [Flavobacteriaceae bacterium]